METHSYEYDRTLPWTPQQNQFYQSRPAAAQNEQQLPRPQNQGLPKHCVGQKPRVPEKMPKVRVLALANTLKRWLAVASIVGFGTFGGLVALHQVGTTTSQSTQSTSGSSNTSSSSQNSNNFLKQQGGNSSGTSSSSTNSSSTSSSSSTPVTGTSSS